jgi:hypothetical protein
VDGGLSHIRPVSIPGAVLEALPRNRRRPVVNPAKDGEREARSP